MLTKEIQDLMNMFPEFNKLVNDFINDDGEFDHYDYEEDSEEYINEHPEMVIQKPLY